MNKLPLIAALLVCALFVSLSAIFVLGNYQNHNGDFGQYYLHASNVLNGRPWGEYLSGKPAVLIGYPFLLIGPIAAFGLNGLAVGILNSLLWALTAFIFYTYYSGRFQNRITGIIYILSLLFSPYLIFFQQDGQPNIAYSATFALSVMSIALLKDRPPNVWLVIGVILPAFFRVESAALFGAIGLWLMMEKRWRLLWVPVVGIATTVGLDILLDQISSVRSNLLHALNVGEGTGGIAASASETINNIMALFIGYSLSIAELVGPRFISSEYTFKYIADYGLTVRSGSWSISLLVLFIVGFTLANKEKYLDGLAALAHMSIISLFLLPAIPIRYLIPVLPVIVFYSIYLIERLIGRILHDRARGATFAVLACWLLISGGVAFSNFRAVAHIPRTSNSLITPDANEMASWLSTNQENRLVGYWKDRLMQVLLDAYGGDPGKTVGVRSAEKARSLIDDNGLLVIMKRPNVNASMLEAASGMPQARVVFENETFVVFAHR